MLHSLSPGHSVHRGQISVSADREEQLWDRRHSGRCLAKHPEAKMASIASAFLKDKQSPRPGVSLSSRLRILNNKTAFTKPSTVFYIAHCAHFQR